MPHSFVQKRPSVLARQDFLDSFAGVYEHSPWIAEQLFGQGLDPSHDTAEGLQAAMAQVIDGAGREAQLALLRAHPDLAGRLALAGDLTVESRGEQAGAGLDQCSAQELARFQELNDLYHARFGFPFILAVAGKTRAEILTAFETRVAHDPAVEFETALQQVHRIALVRLRQIA